MMQEQERETNVRQTMFNKLKVFGSDDVNVIEWEIKFEEILLRSLKPGFEETSISLGGNTIVSHNVSLRKSVLKIRVIICDANF